MRLVFLLAFFAFYSCKRHHGLLLRVFLGEPNEKQEDFIMRRLLALLLALTLPCMASTAALADSLTVAGLDGRTESHGTYERVRTVAPLWINVWRETYPETSIKMDRYVAYRSTDVLIAGLQKNPVKQDVLTLSTDYYKLSDVMASGGLADLSGEPELSALVDAMHPPFAEAARYEGGVYGVPYGVAFNSFISYNARAWEMAGYSEADVPTSFTALIDFVERWAERCKATPVENIHLTSDFKRFQATSYAEWLTMQLVQQQANQCLAEGKSLVFNTPEIVALLERIAAVSPVLYEVDNTFARRNSPNNGEPVYDLFSLSDEMSALGRMIPSRMTDNDPLLIPVYVSVLSVPANCRNPEAARNFIRLYMGLVHGYVYEDLHATTMWDCDAMLAHALLFTDATSAVPSYSYGAAEQAQAQIARQEAIANDPSASETKRARAQADLDRYERAHWLENLTAQEYQLTAEELAAYQALIPSLRVVSGWNAVTSAKQTERLIQQFASGRITAQEFVERMDGQRQ